MLLSALSKIRLVGLSRSLGAPGPGPDFLGEGEQLSALFFRFCLQLLALTLQSSGPVELVLFSEQRLLHRVVV